MDLSQHKVDFIANFFKFLTFDTLHTITPLPLDKY